MALTNGVRSNRLDWRPTTMARASDVMLPTSRADEFLWGVGIEDTFIGQPSRSGRTLDEYELTGHYDTWREDLGRIAGLGVGWMRYGIPWYRVNPEPGVFDWTWPDHVLPYLREELGILPILDLVHYGTPLWLEGQATHPDYPSRVAEYADRVAERYGHLVPAYTPLNEPVVNALFCGRNGRWPPYMRGDRGYVRILTALARGISLTIAAIRARQSDAGIVHVEASGSLGGSRHVDYQAPDSLDQHFLPADLVMGRVSSRHPLRSWLSAHGADEQELDWFEAHPQLFDAFGINFYPTFRTARRVPPEDELASIGDDLTSVLSRVASRYGLPVILTETSDIASNLERRTRWLETSVAAVGRARDRGANVVGYIWFPAYSCLDWSYRDGRRPNEAYLLHMGLWELHPNGAGPLQRRETPLVDAFRRYVALGAPSRSERWPDGIGSHTDRIQARGRPDGQPRRREEVEHREARAR